MKIKIVIILTVMAACTCLANANATTWYVRDGGGNASQCTGQVNAIYPGTGTNQPCAFNHPRYALGWGCGGGGTSCVNHGSMAAGDTLSISGDSDLTPGAQAQYEIGFDVQAGD